MCFKKQQYLYNSILKLLSVLSISHLDLVYKLKRKAAEGISFGIEEPTRTF
jgi:hypothetical protein